MVIWLRRTTATVLLCASSLSFCPMVDRWRLRAAKSVAEAPCRKWNATLSITTSRTA